MANSRRGGVHGRSHLDVGLVIAIGFAVAFALTNGFHYAFNAIATLVATRAATPGQACRPGVPDMRQSAAHDPAAVTDRSRRADRPR